MASRPRAGSQGLRQVRACPLRARQSGGSRSRTVTHVENANNAQASGIAGDQWSVAPTSQAGGVHARSASSAVRPLTRTTAVDLSQII